VPPVAVTAPRLPVVQAVTGDVEIIHGAERVRASSAEPRAFAPADEIHTPAGARASAELPSGATVSIEEHSLVRLSSLSSGGEELGLARGRVEVHVPRLPRGATLAVRTPDARVTVRGTRFVVEVAQRDAQSVTSVSVLEGSVWVEARGRTVVLERGARFSTGHEPEGAGESTSTSPPAPPSAATPSGGVARNAPPPGALSPHEVESTLPFENDLYLDAMRAAREGNTALAVERLSALLERYPRSPLAPNARLELERLRRGEKAPR
jgi:TolA-binding protein